MSCSVMVRCPLSPPWPPPAPNRHPGGRARCPPAAAARRGRVGPRLGGRGGERICPEPVEGGAERGGRPAAGPLPASPASGRGGFPCPSASRIPFLHRVSFHSIPFAPPPRGTRRTLQMAALAPPTARPASGPCFARIARGRGRASAPARFARLIARASQRAHFACASNRGRSAPGRREGSGPRGLRLPRTHHNTIFCRSSPLLRIISKISNKLIQQAGRDTLPPGSARVRTGDSPNPPPGHCGGFRFRT